jgi:hypothetical protein
VVLALHGDGGIVLRPTRRKDELSDLVASLARTSSVTSVVQRPSLSARRFPVDAITWSAKMTPVAPWPAGTATSNGYPFV